MNKFTGMEKELLETPRRALRVNPEDAVVDAYQGVNMGCNDEDPEAMVGDIKSSGEKRDFGTGAHRDSNTKVLKGRMDLVPAVALQRFAAFCSRQPQYSLQELEAQHNIWYFNNAMESMYAWLEGERRFSDLGPGKFMYGTTWKIDHLSNTLWHTMQLMQRDADKPIWRPTMTEEHLGWHGPLARFDMLSPEMYRRVSIHYQKGGINYGDRNWELGMPVMVTWDSAARHLTNWLENVRGDKEDHLAAVGWNIMCTMHTIEMVNRGVVDAALYDAPAPYYGKKVADDDDAPAPRGDWR